LTSFCVSFLMSANPSVCLVLLLLVLIHLISLPRNLICL
jgi:hypothetical protein